ncbi:hypothetical protein PF011_g30959 [Phytophthora fragariae]|uniref:Reverse transcriptase domain-containing protein n=3 Tax=Phytophthora fragariae TaxID=53985 RepID=A0A6A3GN70_9STRA|nr:hypothetical protein PF011_g30959 [Phytophthora fragariae]
MVLGMPWLARHDPVIDWTKRTIVHFGSSGAKVSDGPVGAARAPRGARDPPGEVARRAAVSGHPARTPTTEIVVGRKCESNQKTQIRSDSRGSRSVKSDAVVSTISVDTQVQQEEPVTNKDSDSDASTQGADAIGLNVERRSGVEVKKAHRLWEPTLQTVRTVANVPHRKCLRARVQPGCTTKRYATQQGLIACARGLNPPAIKRKICPRPGPDKTRRAEPGSAQEANDASEQSCASLGQGPRRYSQCLTPIPRKDVIIDSMALSTIFSALDLRDGFYQILMRESDIPITAVSTPSGMLWEWLVMPQGLKNAPATFNRCVTHLLRSVRDFAPSYFDDVFIHSRAVDGKSEEEMHKEHLRRLFALMRKHKLYANLKKCIFGVARYPSLGVS